jgi:hypothetical protein
MPTAHMDLSRAGNCVCGQPMADHFDARNRFVSCADLDAPTVPDSDVVSLLQGDYEALLNHTAAMVTHLFNHRRDFQPDALKNLSEGLELLRTAFRQMACDACGQLAVSRRATDFYCAEHDANWTACGRCRQDVLKTDTFDLEGTRDVLTVCEACLPSGEDE